MLNLMARVLNEDHAAIMGNNKVVKVRIQSRGHASSPIAKYGSNDLISVAARMKIKV
jgi:hypothetical protein